MGVFFYVYAGELRLRMLQSVQIIQIILEAPDPRRLTSLARSLSKLVLDVCPTLYLRRTRVNVNGNPEQRSSKSV
jgi:hypothetical protein